MSRIEYILAALLLIMQRDIHSGMTGHAGQHDPVICIGEKLTDSCFKMTYEVTVDGVNRETRLFQIRLK